MVKTCNKDCFNCPFPDCIIGKGDPDKLRELRREYARRYRESQRDKYNAYHRAYYEANRERITEQRKSAYAARKEK